MPKPSATVPATFALAVPSDDAVAGAVMLLSTRAADRRIGDRKPTPVEIRAARECVAVAHLAIAAGAPAPFASWAFKTADGLAIPAARGLAILAGFADARIGRITGRV
jgi:hypothetical protein